MAQKKQKNDYWARRTSKAQERLTNKTIAETEAQLKKYYSKSMEKIIGQFELTYNEVLSSIEEGKQPTPADLYKLDSYWQMLGQTQGELQKLGDKQMVLLADEFFKQYQGIYDSLAVPGEASFSTIDTQLAKQMLNSIWCADGKSWSDRVWQNTELLQQTLNDNLIHCLVVGKKPTELKKILMEQFNVSYRRADMLVRTEMAHIQTEAAKQRYKDYGIKEVEILADKDERRCDVCGKLHKKRFPINSQMPIPAHPNCRCCIVPVVE